MGVVLLILKIIGWTILAILAIVIAALFVKIRIVADYGEEKSVLIRWLFLKIPVSPQIAKYKAVAVSLLIFTFNFFDKLKISTAQALYGIIRLCFA